MSTVISAPREQVFDYLQDIANHGEFTDHYLVDWHLTRIDSVGLGAGARFRVRAPGNRYSWADVTFAEVDRPYRIVEVGRTGKENRVGTLGALTSSLLPRPGPRGPVTLETMPAMLSDRLMESFAAGLAAAQEQARTQALLRSIIERGEGAGRARHGGWRVDCASGWEEPARTGSSSRLALVSMLGPSACSEASQRRSR